MSRQDLVQLYSATMVILFEKIELLGDNGILVQTYTQMINFIGAAITQLCVEEYTLNGNIIEKPRFEFDISGDVSELEEIHLALSLSLVWCSASVAPYIQCALDISSVLDNWEIADRRTQSNITLKPWDVVWDYLEAA